MIADFEPLFLSPLSSEPRSSCLQIPAPPSPRKRSSERVSSLLLDNLELFEAPLSNKQPRLSLQMQPTTAKSALMENALKRLREKAANKAAGPIVPVSPRARKAPTLPRRRSSAASDSGESPVAKVEMDRTPIRSPPVRSNSGLARCA